MKAIREQALTFLSYRDHSQLELRAKLVAKSYQLSDIEAVLLSMSEEGWQSDLRFTEGYIERRIAGGWGPLRIQMELKQRGVSNDLIIQYLTQDENFWWDCFCLRWQKKYTSVDRSLSWDNLDSHARHLIYQKRAGYFIRRGFHPSWVHNWVKHMIQRLLTHANVYDR